MTADDLTRFIDAVDLAMRAEGIGSCQREHVINRLLYGTPHPGNRRTDEITVTQVNIPVAPRGVVPGLHMRLPATELARQR